MELKERIKQKADELYQRYGVKSVTMDDIASQMGISKKTIYQCFSDKNELVDAVIAEMLQCNRSMCLQSREHAENAIHEVFLAMDNMESMFENMNSTILFDIERNHPATFKKFKEFKYSFLLELIRKNIERGKQEEIYRPEMDLDIIARIRLECAILPFSEELFPKKHYNIGFLHRQLMEFFLYGMATPKGYKLITKYKKEREKSQETKE